MIQNLDPFSIHYQHVQLIYSSSALQWFFQIDNLTSYMKDMVFLRFGIFSKILQREKYLNI